MGTPIFKICGEDVNVDQAIADALSDSGLAITVTVPTALTALDDAPMTNGAAVWVATQRVPYYLDKTSTATLVANSVVATGSGTGRWVRDLNFNDQTWLAQGDWFIDPILGSDTNDGFLFLTPIATIAEWYRRTGGQLVSNTTFLRLAPGITGNWPAADPFIYSTRPVGDNRTLRIVGTNKILRSGTITASTTGDPAVNTSNTISDGAINWTADVGRIIVFTSGASNGNHAVIAKDNGAGAARIGVVTDLTGVVLPVPAIGTTYNIVSGTSIAFNGRAIEGGITAVQGAAFFVQDLDINNDLRTWNYADTFARCRFLGPNGFDARYAFGARFLGCSIGPVGSVFVMMMPSRFYFSSSTFFNGAIRVIGPASIVVENCFFQGAALQCGAGGPTASDTLDTLGGKINLTNGIVSVNGAGNGHFDVAGSALLVQNGGVVRISTRSLYGSGNGAGLTMNTGAKVFVDPGYVPPISVTGTQLVLPGGPDQIPKLVGGAVVPLALTCNSFASWNNPGFGRTVTTQLEDCGLYGTT